MSSSSRLPILVTCLALVVGALAVVFSFHPPGAAPAGPRWQRPSRASQLELLPLEAGDLVLLGASLVEHGEWSELLPEHRSRNRGVAGDKVADVLARLDPLLEAGPRAAFVMVGLNDVLSGRSADEIEDDHRRLARRFAEQAPGTRLVLMNLLPVRREGQDGVAANAAIDVVNAGLARVAQEQGCELLDLAPPFRDDDGQLRADLTVDGIHLTGPGYLLWRDLLREHGGL
jgi:lysophospholipase L1-like esterase